MDSTITAIGNMPWLNIVLIVLGAIAIIISACIFIPKAIKKSGLKKVSKEGAEFQDEILKGVKIRTVNYVHETQRKQLAYVKMYVKSFTNKIGNHLKELGYDYMDFNFPYISELLFDEIMNWIIFNNIENTQDYKLQHDRYLWLVYSNAINEVRDTISPETEIKFHGDKIPISECDINWFDNYFSEAISQMTNDIVSSLVGIKSSDDNYAAAIR